MGKIFQAKLLATLQQKAKRLRQSKTTTLEGYKFRKDQTTEKNATSARGVFKTLSNI